MVFSPPKGIRGGVESRFGSPYSRFKTPRNFRTVATVPSIRRGIVELNRGSRRCPFLIVTVRNYLGKRATRVGQSPFPLDGEVSACSVLDKGWGKSPPLWVLR